MTGASASSGRRPRTRSRRLRTSSAASFRSVPHAKFSVTRLEPSDEVDSSRSRPATALIACSMRPRDELFHLERADAGVADADRDARERDVRHQVDRQPQRATCQPIRMIDAREHEHRDRTLESQSAECSSAAPLGCRCRLARRGPGRRRAPSGRVAATMRSPSLSAPAPVVMTRAPSSSPLVISICSPSRMPTSTGRNLRGHRRRWRRRAGALPPRVPLRPFRPRRGDEHAGLAVEVDERVARHGERVGRACRPSAARAQYMPGFSRKPAFGTSISISAVRVAGSKTGATRLTRPVNFSPGNASTSTLRRRARPARACTSFSTRLATIRTVRMSTTDATGAFGADQRARIEIALADEAVDRRRDHACSASLIFSSSSRAFACSNCALREIELRHAPPDTAPRCRRRSAAAAAAARAGS